MSGGKQRLSLSDRRLYYSHVTITDGYTPSPISGHVCHTLWIHQISEKLRLPGWWFHCRVQLLTAGYMTCSVNWHFLNKTFVPIQAFELLVHKYKFKKKCFNCCLSYDAPGLQNRLPLDIYRAFQE